MAYNRIARWGGVPVLLASVASVQAQQTTEPVLRAHGQSYATWADFVLDVEARGTRCMPPSRDELSVGAPLPASDCSINSTNPIPAYDPGDIYELTVVVHVIRQSNGSGNVSPALVQSQIDILNEDFRALPGTPGSAGIDSGIQFVLATEDPAGNPTTGITYSNNNTWFNDGGNYWNSLAWDPDRYINIYTNSAGGFLGYVPGLPQNGGLVGSNADRVVVLWSSFGRNAPIGPPYNQGRTTTHEVGHYLGLFHTFDGGCGSASACYTSGDLICDTNRESSPNYSCAGGSSCGSVDPSDNYMNYTDDVCMDLFTVEQVRRMRCTLQFWRPDLIGDPGDPGGPGDDPTGEGINIDIGANTTFPTPNSGFGAAAGQSGPWNAVSGSAAGTSLTDVNGANSGASISVSGGNGDFESDNANTSGNVEDLLDDLQDAGTSTWTISNLLSGNYDVYVYSWAPDDRTSFESEITVVGGSAGAQVSGGQAWTGAWIEGGQYVKDTVANATSVTIQVAATSAGTPTSVNGIQIVPAEDDPVDPGLGTIYCSPANSNSTGGPAVLSSDGSPSINDNDVNFTVAGLPDNQFGYFLMADSQAFVPFFAGSQGNLCLGSPLVRFAANVLNSGATGEVSFSPNLANLPNGTFMLPGDTWNFQMWYRDNNPGSTSNTSDAVSILFL